MKLTIEDYSKKVKILETKLNVLDDIYEKSGKLLDVDSLNEMEASKNEILKELITITREAFAAIGTGNTRAK